MKGNKKLMKMEFIFDKQKLKKEGYKEEQCLEAIRRHFQEYNSKTINYTHNDVYYLDGIPQPVANKILDIGNDILINDGMVIFGIGNHNTGDEIGKYKSTDKIG